MPGISVLCRCVFASLAEGLAGRMTWLPMRYATVIVRQGLDGLPDIRQMLIVLPTRAVGRLCCNAKTDMACVACQIGLVA